MDKIKKITVIAAVGIVLLSMTFLGVFASENNRKLYLIGGTYAYDYKDSHEYIVQRGSITDELNKYMQIAGCREYEVVNVMEESLPLGDMLKTKEYDRFLKKINKEDIVIVFLDNTYMGNFQEIEKSINDNIVMPLAKCDNVYIAQPYHIGNNENAQKYEEFDKRIAEMIKNNGFKFIRDTVYIESEKNHIIKLDYMFNYPLMNDRKSDNSGYDFNTYNQLGARSKAVQILYTLSNDKLIHIDWENEGFQNKELYSVTRGEFIYNIMKCADIKFDNGVAFNDVPMNHKYADAIYTAKALGIVSGDNGCFRPDDYITTDEVAVIAVNILEYKKYDFGSRELINKKPIGYDSVIGKEVYTEQFSDYAADSVWKLYHEDIFLGLNGGIDSFTIYTIYDIYDFIYEIS